MKRLAALCLVLCLALTAGCAPAPAQAVPRLERTFFAMDTVMTLRLYQGGGEELPDLAEQRVRDLESPSLPGYGGAAGGRAGAVRPHGRGAGYLHLSGPAGLGFHHGGVFRPQR